MGAGRQRFEKIALALPIVGMILFLPPVTKIFDLDNQIASIPLPVVYLFLVWLALIASARLVAGRLKIGLDGKPVHELPQKTKHPETPEKDSS